MARQPSGRTRLKRVPTSIQTIYAELNQQVQQDTHDETYQRGSYVSKEIKGKRYWYFQDAGGAERRKQTYVGPETPELLARIEGHRIASVGVEARRQMVSQLRGIFPSPDRLSGEAIGALAKSGVFRLRGILIGTAALQIYCPMLGIRSGLTYAQTGDVDVAQFRNISVAVDDAVSAPMTTILKDVAGGLAPAPRALQVGNWRYVSKDKQFSVEFLTPMQGPDTDAPEHLPALATDAQPLRFLDFLLRSEVSATALFGAGIAVRVPDPVRFALHKLIVSQRRSDLTKARKDRQQAYLLLEALVEDRPYELREAWKELVSRGDKWKNLALAGLEASDPVFRTFFMNNNI
jgi:hypothetical protein